MPIHPIEKSRSEKNAPGREATRRKRCEKSPKKWNPSRISTADTTQLDKFDQIRFVFWNISMDLACSSFHPTVICRLSLRFPGLSSKHRSQVIFFPLGVGSWFGGFGGTGLLVVVPWFTRWPRPSGPFLSLTCYPLIWISKGFVSLYSPFPLFLFKGNQTQGGFFPPWIPSSQDSRPAFSFPLWVGGCFIGPTDWSPVSIAPLDPLDNLIRSILVLNGKVPFFPVFSLAFPFFESD